MPARDPEPERLRRRDWGSVGSGAVFSTTRDLHAWLRALRDGRVLRPDSVRLLFAPQVAIAEGSAALGWFVSTPGDGTRRVFTRGNDDFGANGLVYEYPDLERDVVILSHAGQRGDGLSFSRAALAVVEKHLLREPPDPAVVQAARRAARRACASRASER